MIRHACSRGRDARDLIHSSIAAIRDRQLRVQTTADNFAEFSLRDFRLGMHYLLRNRDSRAARQLIFIGEQNNVRDLLDNKDK